MGGEWLELTNPGPIKARVFLWLCISSCWLASGVRAKASDRIEIRIINWNWFPLNILQVLLDVWSLLSLHYYYTGLFPMWHSPNLLKFNFWIEVTLSYARLMQGDYGCTMTHAGNIHDPQTVRRSEKLDFDYSWLYKDYLCIHWHQASHAAFIILQLHLTLIEIETPVSPLGTQVWGPFPSLLLCQAGHLALPFLFIAFLE